jgi:hypothetical protein
LLNKPHPSAASFRLLAFVAFAIAAAGLWIGLFRSTGGIVTATPAIPRVSSQSIFAPAIRLAPGLAVRNVIRNDACTGCIVHVGSGGAVRSQVPSGAGQRTAYALLDIGDRAGNGQVLVHDVIGFGRGDRPAQPAPLLQLLDSRQRVIFELVAQPNRRLYLSSPAGGLRSTPLLLATGATVPNDGIAGVAVDVAVKTDESIAVSVNGVRTAAVRRLSGARTTAPRFLAAGVIGYSAPPSGTAITVNHTQVSVSTSSVPAATAPATQAAPPAPAAPAPVPQPPPAEATPPLASLSPPTISGRAVVGGTLTATPGSWSDATATFSYGWERCDGSGDCTSIDGADGTTYTLVRADRNAFVRVRVTAHVASGSLSKTSAAIGPVSPAAPTALAVPTITGEAVVGMQLTSDPGLWSDPNANFEFAWQRCNGSGSCVPISGADAASYTPSTDDLGSSLRVAVTASNGSGANTAFSAPTPVVLPAAPSIITAPSVNGDTIVGSTLTADPGTWSDPAATFTYAWLRCDSNGACTTIDGANSTTYTLSGGDAGFRIEVRVAATNAGGAGSADSAPTAPVRAPVPVPTVAPSVTGDATVGSTLTADPGTWSDPAATFTYAWLRCVGGVDCSKIDGANRSTYVLSPADVGYWIGAEVTATGLSGSGSADSNLVGPVVLVAPPALVSAPSIGGDATVGSILSADPGTWSDPAATFTYAWLRCDGDGGCTPIDSATDPTYTLTNDDLGHSVRVQVTAANDGGTTTAQSPPIGPVTPGTPDSAPTASWFFSALGRAPLVLADSLRSYLRAG